MATESKEGKKIIDAQIAVLTHKLGRAPTLDEIMDSLSDDGSEESLEKDKETAEGQEELSDEDIPSVLSYKVYYGMKDVASQDGQRLREPDPSNVLFYNDPKNGKFYDVSSRTWLETEPPIVKHLNVRDMEGDEESAGVDIRDAIIHGVMSPDDFSKLCEFPQLVDDRTRKLYELMSQVNEAKKALESMTKSEESDEEIEIDEQSYLEDNVVEPSEGGGVNVSEEFMNTAGVPREEDLDLEPLEGEDLTDSIKTSAFGSGVEKRVRAWIRQELESMKEEIREEMWQAINSSLQEEVEQAEQASEPEEEPIVDDIEEDDFEGEAEAVLEERGEDVPKAEGEEEAPTPTDTRTR